MFFGLQLYGALNSIEIFGVEISALVLAMNGLVEGVFFMLMGMCIADYNNHEREVQGNKIWFWSMAFFTSLVVAVLERKVCMVVGISLDVHLSSIISVIVILYIIGIYDKRIPFLSYIGEKLSGYIYYWHVLVASVLAGGTREFDNSYVNVLLVLGISVILAQVLYTVNTMRSNSLKI